MAITVGMERDGNDPLWTFICNLTIANDYLFKNYKKFVISFESWLFSTILKKKIGGQVHFYLTKNKTFKINGDSKYFYILRTVVTN